MNKMLLVAKYEYLYNLKRPAFLFAAFGTPIFFVIIMAVVTLASAGTEVDLATYGPVGYVDQADVLTTGQAHPDYPALFQSFESIESARTALDDEAIIAYIELPATYLSTGRVNLYTYQSSVPENLTAAIELFLLTNFTTGIELPFTLERLQEGVDIRVQTVDDGRTSTQGGLFVTLFLPVIFAFLLITASLTNSGFLMSGLVQERTNRVIEILVTSVTPLQLLAGKIIGLGLLGLTQVVILLGTTYLGLALGQSQNLEFLQGVNLPPALIALALIYFLVTFFFMAALLAGIGAVSSSEQESRQISGFLTIPFMIPYLFFITFITEPNGTVPTILSLIPFTAPMSVLIRVGLTDVPAWQIGLSLLILVLTTVFSVWAGSKMFRWGLLLYGKKFDLREVVRVIFGRARMETSTPQNITSQESV
ncbi:MAG: ABC transporter permease [Anaerolineae bacterium]|jgi:ABC-2 type transport system permease protein|nr:ABC transporter permease [Anaerolineae bacterium]